MFLFLLSFLIFLLPNFLFFLYMIFLFVFTLYSLLIYLFIIYFYFRLFCCLFFPNYMSVLISFKDKTWLLSWNSGQIFLVQSRQSNVYFLQLLDCCSLSVGDCWYSDPQIFRGNIGKVIFGNFDTWIFSISRFDETFRLETVANVQNKQKRWNKWLKFFLIWTVNANISFFQYFFTY